jgi:hypothetical protein
MYYDIVDQELGAGLSWLILLLSGCIVRGHSVVFSQGRGWSEDPNQFYSYPRYLGRQGWNPWTSSLHVDPGPSHIVSLAS